MEKYQANCPPQTSRLCRRRGFRELSARYGDCAGFCRIKPPAIAAQIVKSLKLHVVDDFTTVHNYIDIKSRILRKGSVSAEKGERLLIPINMRDGSLLCIGKGNEDWNCSAPHGAGRLMSRAQAKQSFTVSEFKKQMAGIYTLRLERIRLTSVR